MSNYDFGDEFDLDDEGVGSDIHATDAAIFGELRGKGGRMVAKATPLAEIWFDLTQPRNVIPRGLLRTGWNGNPDDMEELLSKWFSEVQALMPQGETLAVSAMLRGEREIDMDMAETHPQVKRFMEVVKLAVNIRENGLTNPVTASKVQRNRWKLHTGERRLLAHWMLNAAHINTDKRDQWSKITAIEVSQHDVYTQISENTARHDMNAISMARAFALMIMDMYRGEHDFGDEVHMRTVKGSNRPYFAQVADGEKFKIKYGMGSKVQAALNTSSRGRASHYRKMLTLPDYLWVKADEEDWAEGFIRDIIAMGPKVMGKITAEQWDEGRIRREIKAAQKPDPVAEARKKALEELNTPSADTGKPFTTVNSLGSDNPSSVNTEGQPYRTTTGERMGLYDDEAGDSRGVVLPQERPTLTKYSPKADFDLYPHGSKEWAHRHEWAEDETWGEADEAQAEEVAQQSAYFDANPVELDDTRLTKDHEIEAVIQALMTLAQLMGHEASKKALHGIYNRSLESIRGGLMLRGDDLHAYGEEMDAEKNVIAALLDTVDEQMHAYMEELWVHVQDVWAGPDG